MMTKTNKARNYFAALVVVAMVAAVLLGAGPARASTTFTVTNTNDDGAGSLRQAILDANANNNAAEVDRIDFDIPGTGVQTIFPGSALPAITEPVVVDGYSQPGSSVNTLARGTNAKLLVEINGGNASSARLGGLTVSASNTMVKGLVINHFVNASGIDVDPDPSGSTRDVTGVRIQGNFIGTDASGTFARGNESGVSLFGTSDSNIGGTLRAQRNLISGNEGDGVFITEGSVIGGGSSSNNKVRGNVIGTQKNATSALGNGLQGVQVAVDPGNEGANGNSILSNVIFSNGGIGIDLGPNGPTANDAGDLDFGSNNLQNKPSLGSAKTVSGKTIVTGTLRSRPGASYTIQFFSNPSGTGQGRTFLGQKTDLSVDGSGKGTFTFSPSSKVAAGQTITATATNKFTSDTSEFSAARKVVAG